MARSLDKTDFYHVVSDVPWQGGGSLGVPIAGRFQARRGYYTPPRTLDRAYVFIYTEDGRGRVRIGTRHYESSAGDAFLLAPGVEHEYETSGTHWHLVWFHCVGRLPEVLRGALGQTGLPPVPCGTQSTLPAPLFRIIDELEEKPPDFDIAAGAQALLALIELDRCRRFQLHGRGHPTADLVGRAVAFFSANLGRPLRISEIAGHLHVSPRHLSRAFRRETGQSPIRYLLRLRLAEAKRLLLTSDASIQDVARRVGIPDAYYFSRLFREKIGRSPTAFRREETTR